MTQLSGRRLVWVTAGTMLALLLAALDQTIVGTAMPRIVAELKGLDYYTWVITAYLVTSTTMTPIAGKLGDLFGRKPFLLAGMIGFVAASALCGLSQNMAELIIFRGIQGIFGGVLFATVFAVIGDLFPPARRAKMQGLFAGLFGLASVIGPTAGGYLTDYVGWRWVFYINLPLGILAIMVVFASMPALRTQASLRDIDVKGALALVAGLIPLLVALSITRDHDWTSPLVLGMLAWSAFALIVFFLIEQRDAHPIVPFALFLDRTFSVSVITGFFTAVGMFGVIVFVPLIYQGVLGVSATNSGQLLIPMMVGLVLASAITGQLIARIRYYRFLGTAGVALMIFGTWLLTFVTAVTVPLEVARDIFIVGVGLGVTFPLYLNAVQSALPQEYMGVASSQIQFWRNLGGTVGAAVLGTVLSRQLPGKIQEQLTALHLPPQAIQSFSGGAANPQSLFDPAQLAAARAKLPPQLAPMFDQIVHAIRMGLATALHDVFLYAMILLLVALVASVFLKDVPLRGRASQPKETEEPVAVGAA